MAPAVSTDHRHVDAQQYRLTVGALQFARCTGLEWLERGLVIPSVISESGNVNVLRGAWRERSQRDDVVPQQPIRSKRLAGVTVVTVYLTLARCSKGQLFRKSPDLPKIDLRDDVVFIA
jgi:hypothetical protein